jgi:hypothetical protein
MDNKDSTEKKDGRGKNKPTHSKKRRRRYHPPKKQNYGNSSDSGQPIQKKEPESYPDCPVCGKSVRNLNIAIEEKSTRAPAHFECILRELGKEIQLQPKERLHYLGSGCFGVLQFEEGKGLASFSIKRRIQYEDSSNRADWRKNITFT